jgi:ribonuclease P/MRP protein subunit RPP1
MYYDLNVPPASSAADLERTVATLAGMGYDGVAINVCIEGPLNKATLARLRAPKLVRLSRSTLCAQGGALRFPGAGGVRAAPDGSAPARPATAPNSCPSEIDPRDNFYQFSRLTVETDDHAHLNALVPRSPVVQSFDLVAVAPMSQRAFTFCCTSGIAVDIISIGCDRPLPFRLDEKSVGAALARGLTFEVCFGGALRDASARRHFVANATAVFRATRGRSVILSSGALSSMECRAPRDVANLAALVGAGADVARAAVGACCEAALEHAQARQRHRGAGDARQRRDPSEDEERPLDAWRWQIGAHASLLVPPAEYRAATTTAVPAPDDSAFAFGSESVEARGEGRCDPAESADDDEGGDEDDECGDDEDEDEDDFIRM